MVMVGMLMLSSLSYHLPWVNAKFSDDGRKLIADGKGDVTIRLKYDDNPNYAGELFAQSRLTVLNGGKKET